MDTLLHAWQWVIETVGASHPALLFAGMALLPLAGVPASPLWIAAGIRLGTPGGAALAAGALVINFTVGYWLARAWLREPLARLLARRNYRMPVVEGADETQLIVLLRITPGIPLCVQNYLLGLAKVSFGRYLLISWPIQFGYALAFVWFGNSVSGSSAWRMISALALVIAATLAVRIIRRKMRPPGTPAASRGKPPL